MSIHTTINAVARFTDNGDGSTSITLYNNRDELALDLLANGGSVTVEEIESGDDPYRNGTISDITLDIEYDDSAQSSRLSRPVFFSTDG